MISDPIALEPSDPTVLTTTNQRSVLQSEPGLLVASTPHRQNASGPPGAEDLTPITARMRRVLPFETLVQMTALVVPLQPREYLFRRGWFYGITGFTAGGIPNVNAANVNMGNNERYLPWQIVPYGGLYGLLLDAPLGHVYDLSKIFAYGQVGDAIFLSVE